jgi:hypothetical protein
MDLTTNRTNFHEWGEALPGILLLGLIRGISGSNAQRIGHPSRTGSFVILNRMGGNAVVIAEFSSIARFIRLLSFYGYEK